MTYLYKNREFWEVLERIKPVYENSDRYLYIPVAFRELYSEKTASRGEHAKLYSEYSYSEKSYLSSLRKKRKLNKLYKEINSNSRRFY